MKLTRYYKMALLSSLITFVVLTGCAGTTEEGKAGQDSLEASASGIRVTPSFSTETFIHGVRTTSSSEEQDLLPHTLKFKRFAPFFAHPYTPDTMGAMDVFFYGETGSDFEVLRGTDDWICINTTYGQSWVPKWYSEEEAGDIITQKPAEITPAPSAKLALYPGSSVTLSREQWQDVVPDGKLISVLRWQDWRGIVITPLQSYKDYRVVHPALLWIQDSEVSNKRQLEGKLATAKLPSDMIRAIADIVLPAGTTPQEVFSLFGEPTLKESSISLNYLGSPLRVGQDWRYEGMESKLVVTFSQAQKLERLTWELPLEKTENLRVMANQHPLSRYIFQPMDQVSSKQLNWTWRNQGDLAFAYLRYATPSVLLIYGDDGGLSGMHNDSSLYAISRKSGRKLWQIDAGFGGSFTTLDEGGQYVTVLTPFSKVTKEYDYHLRRVRMTDGKMMWEKFLPQSNENNRLTGMIGAGSQVILYGDPMQGEDMPLLGLNASTGKVMWSKKVEGSSRVMNRGDERYLLIKQREKLQALDPDTGAVVWTTTGEKAVTGEEPNEDFYLDIVRQRQSPFGPADKERWILLGKERLLIELQTGKVKSRYTPQQGMNESIRAWSGSLLLIQRETSVLSSEKGSYETILFDTATGKERWRKKGGVGAAIFEGNILYLFLNGPATALDVATGTLLWQQPISEVFRSDDYALPAEQIIYSLPNNELLVSSGQDLLLVDKSNGESLFRLADVVIDFPEARDNETQSGLINSDGQDLYLGSANGKFSKLKLPLP